MKETAGSKEFDFVEKASNTYPNLCGPVNQHANQEEGKYKKEERAKGGGCTRCGSGGEAYNATEKEECFPLGVLAVT